MVTLNFPGINLTLHCTHVRNVPPHLIEMEQFIYFKCLVSSPSRLFSFSHPATYFPPQYAIRTQLRSELLKKCLYGSSKLLSLEDCNQHCSHGVFSKSDSWSKVVWIELKLSSGDDRLGWSGHQCSQCFMCSTIVFAMIM